MKKLFCNILLLLAGLLAGKADAQKADYRRLEQITIAAYKKAYPACVQLYAYDTVAKRQAGGVFSGVVISKDGYIFTAAHVTTPGVTYRVAFPDGKTCLGTGLGKIELANDKTIPDVALIRIITPGTWPFAETGSSSTLKRDEPCISISYPESLMQPKPVLRFGYILNVKNERGFIQSTCLMEPGDSGGPLFDCLGRVIGLHSAIEIPEETNYEVPVDLYKKYFTALKQPKVYNAYPDHEDAYSTHSETGVLPSFVTTGELNTAALKYQNTCLTVVSTVQGKQERVDGTVFSFHDSKQSPNFSHCLVVSKSSLVGNSPQLICADGRRITAKVKARDKENDVVLLEPAVNIKGGISYWQLVAARIDTVHAGTFLISPQPDTTGTVSISGCPVFTVRKMSSAGFLGLGFKSRNAPLMVSYVFPNLNNSVYQVKTGDEVLGIDSVALNGFDDFAKTMERFWPGDTIKLRLRRADTIFTKAVELDTIPQRHINHPAEMFAGGKSSRRDGFNAVFTHDAILKPERCGGPVFDLEGNFRGINIARFSRASCLTIPAGVIFELMSSKNSP